MQGYGTFGLLRGEKLLVVVLNVGYVRNLSMFLRRGKGA